MSRIVLLRILSLSTAVFFMFTSSQWGLAGDKGVRSVSQPCLQRLLPPRDRAIKHGRPWALLIGDSVDRELTAGACWSLGGKLHTLDPADLHFRSADGSDLTRWTVPAAGSVPPWRHSWDCSVCELIVQPDAHLWPGIQSNGFLLVYLHHSLGVHPSGPWHMHGSRFGDTLTAEQYNAMAVNTGAQFKTVAYPALEMLTAGLGHPPDAVLVQSLFWDIARYFAFEKADFEAWSTDERLWHHWIDSWSDNATEIVQAVRDFPGWVSQPPWLAWRASNTVAPAPWDPNSTWLKAHFVIPAANDRMCATLEARTRNLWSHVSYIQFGLLPHCLELRDTRHPIRACGGALANALRTWLRQD